jgi:hypothetical protein
MMDRCRIGGSYQRNKPAYLGCYFSEEFGDFSRFCEWAITQQGCFDQTYNLDKDLLVKGNKVYSRETCVYVPKLLNSLFVSHPKVKDNNTLPVGVYHRRSGFISSISINGEVVHSCLYTTQEAAREWYVEKKLQLVDNWIKKINEGIVVVDGRVLTALVNFEVS